MNAGFQLIFGWVGEPDILARESYHFIKKSSWKLKFYAECIFIFWSRELVRIWSSGLQKFPVPRGLIWTPMNGALNPNNGNIQCMYVLTWIAPTHKVYKARIRSLTRDGQRYNQIWHLLDPVIRTFWRVLEIYEMSVISCILIICNWCIFFWILLNSSLIP